MARAVFAQDGDIRLLYAQEGDRALIYAMAFEEEGIWRAMIRSRADFPWSQIRDEETCFFSNEPGRDKYYLIAYRGEIAGTVSHAFNDAPIANMELDIWLRSARYTGRGIGSRTLRLLMDTLADAYGIRTFLIRPWRRNERAIRAYAKCGFEEVRDFDPRRYYTKYLDAYGGGDFGEETATMVHTLEA